MTDQAARRSSSARARSSPGRARTARPSRACSSSRPTSIRRRSYPLLCIIHGGPTGVDRPALLAATRATTRRTSGRRAARWCSRSTTAAARATARSSAQLNVRNLGVGDAWDVLSGVDYLVAKGWVDPKRVGCMGWSQGGYISAFLTTSSRSLRGHLGRRRHLELGDLLLQHRHHAVHDPVPRRRPGGRPGDLRARPRP